MKFSIITCTRNNDKWLEKHLNSVYSQSYKNYEHIIIDDASTDASLNVIKKHYNPEKTKVFLRESRSFTIRNHIFGMKQCSGDIIVHLDGDDFFYNSQVLQKVFDTYETTKCWATYGSWVEYKNIGKKSSSPSPSQIGDAENARKLNYWSFTHLRTFKKELISAISVMDLFDDRGDLYTYAPDVALCMGPYEYALKNDKLVYINEPLVIYNNSTGMNEHTVNPQAQIVFAQKIYESPYSVLKLIKDN